MENNVHKKTITDRMKLLLFLLVPIAVASMMTSLLVRESEETRRNEVIEKYVSTLNGDDLKASLKNIKFINYKRKVSLYFGDNLIIDNPTGEYSYEITKYHFYPRSEKMLINIKNDDGSINTLAYKFDVTGGPFHIKMYQLTNKSNMFDQQFVTDSNLVSVDPLYDLLDISYQNVSKHIKQ